MLFYQSKKSRKQNKVLLKTFHTLLIIGVYRLGNMIPVAEIAQEDLKKSLLFSDIGNPIIQLINMYSGGDTTILTPFSLGIIPYINAAIVIDLLAALIPYLEKLQSEDGENGRQTLMFYKKLLTIVFSIFQSIFLIMYLKPYFYNPNLISYCSVGGQLIVGSIIICWLTSLIDKKGIGNGTSIVILTNIVISTIHQFSQVNLSFNLDFFLESIFLFFIVGLICISQDTRMLIKVMSARQLFYMEEQEKRDSLEKENINILPITANGLTIKYNQAGIFPLIIASNLINFLPSFFIKYNSILYNIIYYFLIIIFNYFYTSIFWDPQKISEQLRKSSIAIVQVNPGKETILYLENVVRYTSLLGGIFLCLLLSLYNGAKFIFKGYLLNRINISSLIIAVGVAYEIQKTIRVMRKVESEEKI